MTEKRYAGYIFGSDDSIQHSHLQKVKSVVFQLLQDFLPYSLPPVLRRDIHPYRRTSVTRVEIKEIDAPEGGSIYHLVIHLLVIYGVISADDQAELAVLVDVAGGRNGRSEGSIFLSLIIEETCQEPLFLLRVQVFHVALRSRFVRMAAMDHVIDNPPVRQSA